MDDQFEIDGCHNIMVHNMYMKLEMENSTRKKNISVYLCLLTEGERRTRVFENQLRNKGKNNKEYVSLYMWKFMPNLNG